MAISLASLKRSTVLAPPRLVIYGPHGVGKTSLAAGAPNPVFLQTEDGLGLIDVPTFGHLKTYESVMEAIMALCDEPHDFQTVILDSLDWLEPMVWTETCKANNWANIESPGYGKGYLAAADTWRMVLDGLNALRDERGMTVILLAHAEVKRFDPPESVPYDRYQPKMHKTFSALVQEQADGVFFVNYRVSLVKDTPSDKDSRVRAVGGGQRVLFTAERPSHLAKNRWRMPEQITLPDDPDQTWPELAKNLPFYTPRTVTEKAA